MAVYTARPSFGGRKFCQFQSPGLHSQHPWNSRLYGLRSVLAFFVQDNDFVPFLGVKPGFTICSLVTILIVFCRLPLLALLWFMEWNGCWMQFNIILCVGLQNCLRRRKYCSYRAELSCGFYGKASYLYSKCCSVGFRFFCFKTSFCDPYRVCQWTVGLPAFQVQVLIRTGGSGSKHEQAQSL